MRIDVALAHRDIDAELGMLHGRMQRPGDALHGLPAIATTWHDFVLRYREADGQFYVYVEDTARNRLAGSTVFHRVFEIDRQAERYLRSPHSRYASAYTRRGLGSAVYRWALHAGMCLMSGPRQSVAAHRLWMSLARSHELLFVQMRDRQLHCIGSPIEPAMFQDLDTRMVLLGAGWSPDRLARQLASRQIQQVDERK
ncbi:hypothetical protein GCM10028796_01880 [Ramlibacter monticola]|uniref:N-acetyltransferase n=1 Tax=Ramlibacter monticola TaxID=1926872 RepID=A0A936YZQ9_9BURK|nr:N-acetyltransferase [Ramlibacter monticola]MBL0391521.1 N-acetyltransferase [Ramlibacter monticola]